MPRHLIATVYVDDVAYGPGSNVPDAVAAQITNPAAWSELDPNAAGYDEPAGGQGQGDERSQLESLSKADLVALAESRGADAAGTKAELVDRLAGPSVAP